MLRVAKYQANVCLLLKTQHGEPNNKSGHIFSDVLSVIKHLTSYKTVIKDIKVKCFMLVRYMYIKYDQT